MSGDRDEHYTEVSVSHRATIKFSEQTIGVATGAKGAMSPKKILAFLVILCFERRYPKQKLLLA